MMSNAKQASQKFLLKECTKYKNSYFGISDTSKERNFQVLRNVLTA